MDFERVLVDRVLQGSPVYRPRPILINTIVNSGNSGKGQKSKSECIELTLKATGGRALFPLSCILMVTEGERSGCDVYYGDHESYVAVRESYDEVKRLMKEAGR